jgi:ATP-dependent DNA helicase RecG
MRGDGNITPFPTVTVHKMTVGGSEKAVVMVQPSDAPPVRYKGTVYVSVGSTRVPASPQDEIILTEKRRSRDLPYDLHPVRAASPDDLSSKSVEEYLKSAVAADVLDQNQRSREQQLASLRLVTAEPPLTPTVVGILVAGRDPRGFVPGAYVQFVRFDGVTLADPVKDQKEIDGTIADQVRIADELFSVHIAVSSRFAGLPVEQQQPDYPLAALQQFVRNAVMHRDYEGSNAPVRVYWFRDRVEIHNPGGPFGQVTRENFGTPGITDYRNPHLAEAMHNLGFVQRFGAGIPLARRALEKNGNPPPEFVVQPTNVLVVVRETP